MKRTPQEVVRKIYAYQLGIPNLAPNRIPWYPDSTDKSTWPCITGTKEHVLRFRWDESWEHEDNFFAIRMIVAYIKRHGVQYVPSAAKALQAISEDDLQQRVVDNYVAIQKRLRESKLLDSQNKRIIVENLAPNQAAAVERETTVGPIPDGKDKHARSATLASRAEGVCEQSSTRAYL